MKVGILVALCLFASSAHASFTDGNFIHDRCINGTKAYVIGYATGWMDKFYADINALPVDENTPMEAKVILSDYFQKIYNGTCTPEGLIVGQFTDVLCKYVNDHPEQRHLGGNELMALAMRTAFPCQ